MCVPLWWPIQFTHTNYPMGICPTSHSYLPLGMCPTCVRRQLGLLGGEARERIREAPGGNAAGPKQLAGGMSIECAGQESGAVRFDKGLHKAPEIPLARASVWGLCLCPGPCGWRLCCGCEHHQRCVYQPQQGPRGLRTLGLRVREDGRVCSHSGVAVVPLIRPTCPMSVFLCFVRGRSHRPNSVGVQSMPPFVWNTVLPARGGASVGFVLGHLRV